jgi:hypothetical protein
MAEILSHAPGRAGRGYHSLHALRAFGACPRTRRPVAARRAKGPQAALGPLHPGRLDPHLRHDPGLPGLSGRNPRRSAETARTARGLSGRSSAPNRYCSGGEPTPWGRPVGTSSALAGGRSMGTTSAAITDTGPKEMRLLEMDLSPLLERRYAGGDRSHGGQEVAPPAGGGPGRRSHMVAGLTSVGLPGRPLTYS